MRNGLILVAIQVLMAAGCGPLTDHDDKSMDVTAGQPAGLSAQAIPADSSRSPDVGAPGTNGCTFCNPTGYLVCQDAHGTSCGVPGEFRRCIVEPVCYCEWGGCSCNGTTGTWNCFW